MNFFKTIATFFSAIGTTISSFTPAKAVEDFQSEFLKLFDEVRAEAAKAATKAETLENAAASILTRSNAHRSHAHALSLLVTPPTATTPPAPEPSVVQAAAPATASAS